MAWHSNTFLNSEIIRDMEFGGKNSNNNSHLDSIYICSTLCSERWNNVLTGKQEE